MKLGETIVLLMLATFTVVPTMLAVDYSATESLSEKFLLDPQYSLGTIVGADVSISSDEVVFNCNTDVSELEQISTFVGIAISVYALVLQANPEVGDLTIIWKNGNDPTTGVLTCPKSWVNKADLSNADEAGELITKVILTANDA